MTGISGGDAENYGFNISLYGNAIPDDVYDWVDATAEEAVIPAGSGTLIMLEGEVTSNCLYNFFKALICPEGSTKRNSVFSAL